MTSSTKDISIFSLLKQSLRGDEQNFTQGSIDRAIFLLSVPMILEMSMEALFAVVDALFVSRLHDNDALATVALTESVLTIIYSLGMGLSMGATALVARRIGEKNEKAASAAAVQAIYIGITISLAITFIGIFFSKELLHLMGANEHIIKNFFGYTTWMLCGNITIMMLFLINGVFRGAGNASIAMRTLILSNGLNIILDPIFIFGLGPIPAFGVEGAAIATTIGRGSGVLYQIYHLLKGKGLIKIQADNLPVNWPIIISIIKVSAGSTGQFLIGSASWIFLNRIISSFGSVALGGYLIGIRIIIFAILPAWGMANAAATLVGQNLGAGFPDRAEKSVWRAAFFNLIFLAIITVVFFVLAEPIIVFFFNPDLEVTANAVRCLKIISVGYIFYAYGMVITQSFNGAGDSRTPTMLSLFGFWFFQIPIAYLLAKYWNLGPTGVYVAIVLAETLMATAGIIIFKIGTWKTIKI